MCDEQLIATVYYVHMNPEVAGMCPMRSWRWSSYQEYAGKKWMVDTDIVLGMFGGFAAFDAYEGSPADAVTERRRARLQDDEALRRAIALAGVESSADLRTLPRDRRDALVAQLYGAGASCSQAARVFGIGKGTVSRILSSIKMER